MLCLFRVNLAKPPVELVGLLHIDEGLILGGSVAQLTKRSRASCRGWTSPPCTAKTTGGHGRRSARLAPHEPEPNAYDQSGCHVLCFACLATQGGSAILAVLLLDRGSLGMAQSSLATGAAASIFSAPRRWCSATVDPTKASVFCAVESN